MDGVCVQSAIFHVFFACMKPVCGVWERYVQCIRRMWGVLLPVAVFFVCFVIVCMLPVCGVWERYVQRKRRMWGVLLPVVVSFVPQAFSRACFIKNL